MPRLALAELGIARMLARRDPGRGARRSRPRGRRRPRCRRRGGRRRDACGARGRAGRWPRGRRGGREGCRADAAPRRAVRHRCGSGDRHRGRPRRRDEPRRRGPAGRDGRDGGRAARRVPRHRPGALHGEARRQGAGAATRRARSARRSGGSPRPAASPPRDVRVAVQERPRNDGHVRAARAAGASVELFEHGDVERCLRAVRPGGDLDLVVGIGGAPEGVLTAAAVRALGGWMQARLAPQSDAEAARIAAAGLGPERTYGARRAVRGGRVALPDRGDRRSTSDRAGDSHPVGRGASAPTGRRRSHRASTLRGDRRSAPA